MGGRGYFAHFRDFGGILVIFVVLSIFGDFRDIMGILVILEILGIFWSF